MKPLCAFRMRFVGGALLSCALLGATSVSAQHAPRAAAIVFATPIANDLRDGPSHLMPRLQRVARYGVYYYAPRALPNAQRGDEFDNAEDDEDEFDSADLDADGYLSFREARRANPQWARDFRRIDASGDGYLTREEIEEFYRR